MIRGSGNNKWDLIISKLLHITERHRVEFRAELFNAFNHPQFDDPVVTPGEQLARWKDHFGQRFRIHSDRTRDPAGIEI